MEPEAAAVAALDRIAFLLERALAEPYKVTAFRRAAASVAKVSGDELRALDRSGRLRSLAGVGASTEKVIHQALAGTVPDYVTELEQRPWEGREVPPDLPLLRSLRGDCHAHSNWSDGGSPIDEMARTARALGHEYLVLTDHSPRLTVANGLTAERLRAQLDVVDELNAGYRTDGGPAFRILTGIEVDILDDGSLDQDPELLARLDVVVASLHSGLRADAATITARMLGAVANPRTNILGHCTGRKVVGRPRPPSSFDAEAVFAACVEHDVAVEINCRPERKDPPMALLAQAVAAGCRFAIDTDAHAPGQLAWQPIGAERATRCGIAPGRVVNTMAADELVAWASGAGSASP